jgi:hypothetical protein
MLGEYSRLSARAPVRCLRTLTGLAAAHPGLLSSSKLGQGAQAQLPQYLASERVSCAYYVCVGFTDSDLRQDRLDLVRGICSAREARSGLMVTPRFIDARPKEPASRLRG